MFVLLLSINNLKTTNRYLVKLKPLMRLFSLWKSKLRKMRTFEPCNSRIFVSVQELYKAFDKITTFAKLRKQL